MTSTYSSGGKTYHGKTVKQGNTWLRWAFVEAVALRDQRPPTLRLYAGEVRFKRA